VTQILAVVAATFGIGVGFGPILQALRIARRRSADDVSLPFLLILLTGSLAWLAYGIALPNAALIVPNSVGVLGTVSACIVAWRWRR
jgi:MtN3 and saliva related transmembrane protein